jgi:hypothetical protein
LFGPDLWRQPPKSRQSAMGRIKGVFMNFYNENATSFPFGARALLVNKKRPFAPSDGRAFPFLTRQRVPQSSRLF